MKSRDWNASHLLVADCPFMHLLVTCEVLAARGSRILRRDLDQPVCVFGRVCVPFIIMTHTHSGAGRCLFFSMAETVHDT